jgi:SHS2 domain-containing protein
MRIFEKCIPSDKFNSMANIANNLLFLLWSFKITQFDFSVKKMNKSDLTPIFTDRKTVKMLP